MRRIVLSSLACTVTLMAGGAIASPDGNCSYSTLNGSYIFSANGVDGKPTAFAGMSFYDGKGKTLSVLKSSDNTASTLKGTYHFTRNCRAQITYSNGGTATLFAAPSGDSAVFVITHGTITASSTQRVSKSNLLGINP